jgi:hypothetical protein
MLAAVSAFFLCPDSTGVSLLEINEGAQYIARLSASQLQSNLCQASAETPAHHAAPLLPASNFGQLAFGSR